MSATLNKPENRKLKVMVNGMGKMATLLIPKLLESERYEVLPYALTGPESSLAGLRNGAGLIEVNGFGIKPITPEEREVFAASVLKSEKPDISVDYSLPVAVNGNAEFYGRHRLHFVMGTTGGDRIALEQTVVNSGIIAVIATNMAKQIVGFQEMIKFAAKNFPNLFKEYSLEIVESHQKKKPDPSGTALSLRGDFEKLGVPFTEDDVRKNMIRDLEKQRAMGVPEDALNGHAWHTYDLRSPDRSVLISFTHNVNGRDVYVAGTIDAIEYLNRKLGCHILGEKGKVYSMMDVLMDK